MSELYDSLSGLSKPCFRLFKLDTSTDPGSPLSGGLSTHEWDDDVTFEAISYVWGDASEKVTITCNGQPLEVTVNLSRVLYSLRDAQWTSQMIWIDAICINQADEVERSSQVQLMGGIYERAQSTIIYLGERDASSELVISLCYWFQSAAENGEEAFSITDKSAVMEPLLDFFKRPWWMRSWVIQELCLSRDPIIVTGDIGVPWGLFSRILTQIQQEIVSGNLSDMSLVDRMLKLMRSDGYVAARALEAKRSQLADETYRNSLLEMLADFRNFAVSDPRDKVYGVLGLATPEERALIRPDYSIPTVQCYINAAATILRTSQNLRLLETLSLFQRYRDPDMPSWAPQWDSESRIEEVGLRLAGHIRSVAHTNQAPAIKEEDPFNASGSRQVSGLKFMESHVLALDGLVVDTIKAAGLPLHFPTDMHDGMAKVSDFWSMQTLRFVYEGATQLGEVNDAMSSWERLALQDPKYPTGEDPKDVLLLTLYGHDINLEKAKANFELAMDTHVRQRGVVWIVSSVLDGVSSASKHVFDGILSMRKVTNKNTFDCLPRCWDKCLGRTEKGYLTLLPNTARVGDNVVLLPGGTKPFILRPAGEGRWTVVDVCYVHGIMGGEAWDSSRAHRVELL